jgi:hypothetical protein
MHQYCWYWHLALSYGVWGGGGALAGLITVFKKVKCTAECAQGVEQGQK